MSGSAGCKLPYCQLCPLELPESLGRVSRESRLSDDTASHLQNTIEEDTLTKSVSGSPKAFIASGAIALALCVIALLGFARGASASTSNFCGGQKLAGNESGSGFTCVGAGRTMYATYGWGEQHSVCVWAALAPGAGGASGYGCSGGPGQGVYVAASLTTYYYPSISNGAAGWNIVHGVAYQP